MSSPALRRDADRGPPAPARLALSLALLPLQPLLARVVRKIAAKYPDVLERLGPHTTTRFVIDPVDLPFALYLRPDPQALDLRAIPRADLPEHDARIAGKFFALLRLIDCDEDGDAMFFSRDLDVTGDIEAVVTLRNALDDVDGSIAASVAQMFGPPGELALTALRRFGGWTHKQARDDA
jgi:predicted lipid carrier protein YhbT